MQLFGGSKKWSIPLFGKGLQNGYFLLFHRIVVVPGIVDVQCRRLFFKQQTVHVLRGITLFANEWEFKAYNG